MENKWTTFTIIIYLSLVIPSLVGVGIFFYGWYLKHFQHNEAGFRYVGIGIGIALFMGLVTQIFIRILKRKRN